MARGQITEKQLEEAAVALMDSQGTNPGEDSVEWESCLGNAETDVEAILSKLGIPFIGDGRGRSS